MQLATKALPKFQRSKGRVELGFSCQAHSNGLEHLYQAGCLKALIPKNYSEVPDVILINTAGGITGGDELKIQAHIGERVNVCLTTQTAERVYKTCQGIGKIEVELDLKNSSKLDWIPQETILFDKSAIKRSIKVNMLEHSHLFMVESIILGRQAMNECVTSNLFIDRWEILRNSKPIYIESLKLSNANELSGLATLGKNKALATILYIAPDSEERLGQMRRLIVDSDVFGAATAWGGKMVVRLISECPRLLRLALIYIITEFRGRSLPRVWLM